MARFDALIQRTFDVHGSSGDERICKCPWHDDGAKPNLYVNADTGLYFCHACGAKGHVGKMTGEEARCISLDDLRKKLNVVADDGVVQTHPESWLTQFDFDHDYWTQVRGFDQATIDLFRLGYDPASDRVTIPIRDSRGNVLGVIYRRLDDERPKYLHPRGFQRKRDLYGAWLVRKRRYARVAVVEGPLDAVACWDAKVPAVALHGCVMTSEQASLLRGLGVTTVVAFTDNDTAGEEAIHGIKERLKGLQVLVALYGDLWHAKDPGELHPRQRRHAFLSAVPYHRIFA